MKIDIIKENPIAAVFNTLGFNFISKTIGYIRMILIASVFALNMELDYYFYLQSLVFIFIVVISDINDITLLPKLLSIKNRVDLSRAARSQYFMLTLIMVVSLNLTLYVVLEYILIINNYSKNEIDQMYLIFYSILPVNILMPIFNLFGTFLRARKNFTIFLKAQLIATIFTVASFIIYHDNIYSIGLSGSIGYAIGLVYLFSHIRKDFSFFGNVFNSEVLVLLRQYPKLYIVFGSLGLLLATDRFFLSYYESGNISILQYCIMIVSLPYALLKFEDIFLTRILHKHHIKVSFDIIINIVILISFPLILFVQLNSILIVDTLFSYGDFSVNETERTATILRILSWQILPLIQWPLIYKILQFRKRQNDLIKLLGFSIILNGSIDYLAVFIFNLSVEYIFLITVIVQYTLIILGTGFVDISYRKLKLNKYFVMAYINNISAIVLINIFFDYLNFDTYTKLPLSLIFVFIMIYMNIIYSVCLNRIYHLVMRKAL